MARQKYDDTARYAKANCIADIACKKGTSLHGSEALYGRARYHVHGNLREGLDMSQDGVTLVFNIAFSGDAACVDNSLPPIKVI